MPTTETEEPSTFPTNCQMPFVLDETPGCVALTERGGTPLTFILPQDALGGTFMRVGIDLSTQQEKPQ